MTQAGGAIRKRSKKRETQAGPLRHLLNRPLARIDADAVEEWVGKETKIRPTRTALAFRLLRAFMNWCAEHRSYGGIGQADACARKRIRQKLSKPTAKNDVLQREQLGPWFEEVKKLSPVMSCYLQGVLLTGARREELADLRWEDVDYRWKTLRIRDKVEGERRIPLTPYVADLLMSLQAFSSARPHLPRTLKGDKAAEEALKKWTPSPWVFVSRPRTGERLVDPSIAHRQAVHAAGLPHVTIHGLRRSFGTLSEWVECPAGVAAQIQGHKPSAIAEKHYRVRPIDLLRVWHTRIESWILEQAGLINQAAGPNAGASLHVAA